MKTSLISALKIGFGSACAILIAALIQLPNPASAGTITLLTLVAQTRKQTIGLIGRRYVSFVLTVLITMLLYPVIREPYLAYALFLVIVVFTLEVAGWQDTLSVNAVIGIQFLINQDFSGSYVLAQFMLLSIGIFIALILNLIQPDHTEREELMIRIERAENELQEVLCELSELLIAENTEELLQKKCMLPALREDLSESIQLAARYTNNSFNEHEEWFLPYFETRLAQCSLLHQIYEHAEEVQEYSSAALMISEYLLSMARSFPVTVMPEKQLADNHALRKRIDREFHDQLDFKSQAMLLFVMYDLEEFVLLKQDFLQNLTEERLMAYQKFWKTFRPARIR